MSSARQLLDEIAEGLDPGAARARALARLDELFRTSPPPDPSLDGFHAGRPLALSGWEILDRLGRRLGELHMPWLGKTFDAGAARGCNVLTRRARSAMRVVWPSYVPERELADRIEAFPFRTWIGPGAIDPETKVLKIDYDSEPNPDMVRRVLDELVQVDEGLYLGKVLLRWQFAHRPVGYFSLRSGGE